MTLPRCSLSGNLTTECITAESSNCNLGSFVDVSSALGVYKDAVKYHIIVVLAVNWIHNSGFNICKLTLHDAAIEGNLRGIHPVYSK